ncbi:MAG: hypothetical protein Q7R79_00055, partial [bacterium]|nr:hypothetical protein [bacterium]
MDRQEVQEAQDAIPPTSDRLLMVGVLVNSKTLNGEVTKNPNRYPAICKVSKIFTRHKNVLNLVHFNTKEPDLLLENLEMVTTLAGPHLHGFQLNMAWPNISALYYYRERNPNIKIVLQVGGRALEMVECSPNKLREN